MGSLEPLEERSRNHLGPNLKEHMINVEIPKEVTFDLPEGTYAAIVTTAKPYQKQSGKGKQDWIRIVFEVSVPGMENLECRAGRNFVLSFKQGSDLRNYLAPMLRPDFFTENSAKNVDLEKLIVGLTGKVTLSHFCGDGNTKPFVVVNSFEPIDVEGKD